jgi:hypothetical protein
MAEEIALSVRGLPPLLYSHWVESPELAEIVREIYRTCGAMHTDDMLRGIRGLYRKKLQS